MCEHCEELKRHIAEMEAGLAETERQWRERGERIAELERQARVEK